ncbi:MAG: carboxypeptidase regulatory-like domain-containing protein [Gemmatimonadaceae bacterium]
MKFAANVRWFVGLTLISASTPLAAQKKTPPGPAAEAKSGKAAIAGVVLDSLNRGFLVGAEVIVEGAKRTITTDSLGRFRLDSLTPGTYQVGVFHPLLDSLGISLATKPFHLGADSASMIVLSVPSAQTIIRTSCPPAPRRQGNSVVLGHVQNPETLEAVKGAEVSVVWTDFEVSRQIGIRRTPRLLKDTTDANGTFRICGIPSSLSGTLQARRGNSVTAEIPITLGDADTEIFLRTLLLSPADSGTKTGTASVSGRVVLEGNPAGGGSRVEVVGTSVVTTTNEKGEFTIRNLPSGTQLLIARHLGFGAAALPVDLSPRQSPNVTIKLPKFVAIMDPVLVNARRAATLDRYGFTQRKKMGQGYFLGPEDIQRINPMSVTDVLRRVPGLRVGYGPTGETVESSRGASSLFGNSCVQYFVDDMQWQSMEPGDINRFINGNEIVAVEVYQSSTTPPQYMRGNCDATVVMWTRARIGDTVR